MAGLEVNPNVQPVPVPDWERDARPGSLYMLARGSDANKGALEGAADIIKSGTKLTQDIVEKDIGQKAADAAEQYRTNTGLNDSEKSIVANEFSPNLKGESDTSSGFDTSDLFQEKKGTPPGVSKFSADLSSAKAAYDAGKYSDSYWNSWLQSRVQQIKASYPGWSDQVDRLVEQNRGIESANTQRKAFQREFDAAQRQQNSQANFENTFKKQNLGKIQAGFDQGMFPGAKDIASIPFNDIVRVVSRMDGVEYNIKAQEASLRLGNLRDESQQKAAGRIADQAIGEITSGYNRTLFNKTGAGAPNALLDEAQKELSTGPLDKKTAQALTMAQAQHEAQLRQQLSQFMDTPRPALNGQTYRQILPANVVKEKIDAAVQDSIDTFWNPASNKDYGYLHQTKMFNEAAAQQGMSELIRLNPLAPIMKAYRETFGDQWTSYAISNGAMFQDEKGNRQPVMEALSTIHVGQALSDPKKEKPGADVASPNGWFDQYTKINHSPPPARYVLGTAENDAKAMQDAKADPASRGRMVKNIYGTDNRQTPYLNHFDANYGARVYSVMASKAQTDAVYELAQKDPSVWNTYTQWMRRNAAGIFVQDESTILSENSRMSGKYNVTFDQGTGRFKAEVRPEVLEAQTRAQKTQPGYSLYNYAKDPAPQAVARLNQALDLLDYARQKEGGKSVSQDFLPKREATKELEQGGQPDRMKPDSFPQISALLHSWWYNHPDELTVPYETYPNQFKEDIGGIEGGQSEYTKEKPSGKGGPSKE